MSGSITVLNDADIADDDVGTRHLSHVSATHHKTFQLLVKLLLKPSELQVFRPVDECGHEDNENDGEHNSDALNGTRRTLCRVSYTNATGNIGVARIFNWGAWGLS